MKRSSYLRSNPVRCQYSPALINQDLGFVIFYSYRDMKNTLDQKTKTELTEIVHQGGMTFDASMDASQYFMAQWAIHLEQMVKQFSF